MRTRRSRRYRRFRDEMRDVGADLRRSLREAGDELRAAGREIEGAGEELSDAFGGFEEGWRGAGSDRDERAARSKRAEDAAPHDEPPHRRRRSRRFACSRGGWWIWMIFPLVFWVIPEFSDDIAGFAAGVGAFGAGVVSSAEAVMRLNLASPFADLLSRVLGSTYMSAWLLMLASGLVTGAAAWIALRAPTARTERRRWPEGA